MKRIASLIGLLLTCAVGAFSQAATPAPNLMNFQGRLAKPDGTPLPNGFYAITFRIYGTQTGGAALWTEQENSIVLHNGIFATALGATVPFPATLFNGDVWLEIQVSPSATPLVPRQRLVTVAFAFKANTVADGAITNAKIADGSVTNAKIATGIDFSKLFGVPASILSLPYSGSANTAGAAFAVSNPGGGTGITGTSVNGAGITASSTNSTGLVVASTNGYGLVSNSNAFPALSARSVSGRGVEGTSASGIGVFGSSTDYLGVYGLSTNSDGVNGHSDGVNAAGVSGSNPNGFGIYGSGGIYAGFFSGNVNITGSAAVGGNLSANTLTTTAINFSNGTVQTTAAVGLNSAAGGDLTGTFPNPMLATLASSLTKVSGNAMTSNGTDVSVLNSLNVGSALSALGGQIEVGNSATSGSTPYIDFHFGTGAFQDYNYRMINDADRHLTMIGDTTFAGNVGIGTATPQTALDINGTVQAKDLQITGGSDVAEPYYVEATNFVKPLPGMVVVMDSEHVGQMKVATRAYDGAVGGIISGANGIHPGLTLRQKGTIADGEFPVASIGRVWCYCDADANGPIVTGNLLTTSDTPGYAMRVTDASRGGGAIIGKAMSSLRIGKGLVLVLVSLK